MTNVTRNLLFAVALFVIGAAVVPNAADAQYHHHRRHHHYHHHR